MNKSKLQKLLNIVRGEDTLKENFKTFDNGVAELKKKLEETVKNSNASTLGEVNVKIKNILNKIDFTPLQESMKNLKAELEERDSQYGEEFKSELETRLAEVNTNLANNSSQTESKLQALRVEKEFLQTQITEIGSRKFPEFPDFQTPIRETETKLLALIQLAQEEANRDKTEDIRKSVDELDKSVKTLRSQIGNLGGGNANRNIAINGNSSVLSQFTDINFKNGSNVTITSANNQATKQVDITINSSGSGGGGDISSVLGGTGIAVDVSTPNTPIVILGNTSVTTGTYGSDITVPRITIDQQGRISNASTVGIAFPTNDRVSSVVAGGGINVSNANPIAPVVSRASIVGDISIPDGSAVATLSSIITADGPIGSSSTIPVITYDAKGRLTAVSSVAAASGSGDVTKVGTPVDNQVGVWTGDGTLEGTPAFTFNGSVLTLTATTTQQKWRFDASNEAEITVASNGLTTFNAVGAGASFVFSDTVRMNNVENISPNGLVITSYNNAMRIGGFNIPLELQGNGATRVLVAHNTTDVYFAGAILAASPTVTTLNGGGGSGTNIVGGNLNLAGGKGTGNAAGGAITFQTSDAGASGTTLQSLTTKMTLSAAGNLTLATTAVVSLGTIEVGHATDTTISRSAAGVIAVEGVDIPSISSTNTFTNKRITPRVSTEASSATPTINTDNVDAHSITALAADITSMTTNLSGTPTDFQKLLIRIKDDGTARAITWGASFVAMGVALPTTTVISKVLTVGFIYDTVTSKWGCVASAQEA